MTMTHRSIPVFIPHLGCPHQCVFCNQHSISGCAGFDEASVPCQIEAALQTIEAGTETEIAFFGGSFTGIDRGLMCRLLELASGYVACGRVSGIRLSTRPDMIDREVLSVLRHYPVKTVELGIQSMDDRVLSACRRGHTAEQTKKACAEVLDAGLELVGQMMIGLPLADLASEQATAEWICQAGAAACRIYPTVVFHHTPLADMTLKGQYQPLAQEDAVKRSAAVLEIFLKHGVHCLRIGLCASEELSSPQEVLAGAGHPALGELVWNELYYHRLLNCLEHAGLLGQCVVLSVPQRQVSKTVGQHRCNLNRLLRETGTRVQHIYQTADTDPLSVAPWCAN